MSLPVYLRLAAFDLGSNALRLLVADCARGENYVELLRRRQVVRLGSLEAGALSAAAQARTFAAMSVLCAQARELRAEKLLLAATHACRQARNGESFVASLGRRFSLHQALILSPEQEARLTALGVSGALAGPPRSNAWVLDIGAGSTELAPLEQSAGAGGVFMPFGALNLKEKFIHHDPPLAREMAALRGFIRHSGWPRVDYLAAAAGTAVALAAMEAGSYERKLINNMVIDDLRLQALLLRLSGLNHQQRARLPGLEAGRADIIIPGLLILQAIMSALSLNQVTVVDAGVVEGIMTAFVQKNEEIFNYDPGRDRFDF